MVTEFLIYKGNMTWQILCSAEQAFDIYTKQILDPEGTGKLKLLTELDEIKTKITDYYTSIFGDDKKLHKSARQKVRKIEDFTPEGLANV